MIEDSSTLICSSKSALRESFITSIWRTISPESRRFTTACGTDAGGGGEVFLLTSAISSLRAVMSRLNCSLSSASSLPLWSSNLAFCSSNSRLCLKQRLYNFWGARPLGKHFKISNF